MSVPSDPAAGPAPVGSPPNRMTFDRWQRQHPAAASVLGFGVLFSPALLGVAARLGLPLSGDQLTLVGMAIWGANVYCYYGRRLALDQDGVLQRYQDLVELLRLHLWDEHPPWWRERGRIGLFPAVPAWLTFGAWLLYTVYAVIACPFVWMPTQPGT